MESSQKEVKKELQSEVSEKYDLVGVAPGTYQFAKFGEIDLTKVDLSHADALVKAGFKYLKLKDKKVPAPVKELPKP